MKLYYSPGACSLATHIAMRELDIPFELERVDLSTKLTERGEDFTKINPKGYVPALRLDSGEVLTEAAVTLMYVADQHSTSELSHELDSLSRYRLMEILNFISTEFHKSFGALFNPKITDAHRNHQLGLISKRCDTLIQSLGDKPYLMGDSFSVADAYLFTILMWSHPLNVDLTPWSKITDYVARISERTNVKKAMMAEGLIS